MNDTTKLINKLIIFLYCAVLYIAYATTLYMVVPIIIVITISALGSYFDNPVYKISGFIFYAILCMLFPDFLYFAPLICYDIFIESYQISALILIVPVIVNFSSISIVANLLLLPILFLGYALKYQFIRLDGLKKEYIILSDNMKELTDSLESKNKNLLETQDYEINLAILNERNRIAREIHDNVGHIMSSSLLQVGALIATVNDDILQKSLTDLKNTLSVGMDSVRNSVHDLHEESIDLYTELYKLTREFTFCPLTFDYVVETNPSLKIKYAFIAIVKEALSNIIKHSNASSASLTIREQPALYQLIISDNGNKVESSIDDGIGLSSITTRVESLNGIINIDNHKGFRIFISIPKE